MASPRTITKKITKTTTKNNLKKITRGLMLHTGKHIFYTKGDSSGGTEEQKRHTTYRKQIEK